jgi:hypothetical protein
MRGCRPRAAWRRTWSRGVVVAARLGHINATLISLPVPPVVIRTQRPHPERMGIGGRRRRRRREEEAQRVYGWRGGAASFRRAVVVGDGELECCFTVWEL